jgi:hypothetical protein
MAGRKRIYETGAEKSKAGRDRAKASWTQHEAEIGAWRDLIASATEIGVIDGTETPAEAQLKVLRSLYPK